MTEGMEPARENLREYIDKLMDQGYTIRDGQSPDPELIDPGGSADVEGHPGVLDDAEHKAVLATLARRDWLDQAITVMAAESQFTDVVARLCCLRGVSTLTGFALAVEISDWHRFTGSTISSFVGLMPSEHASGRRGRSPRPATPMYARPQMAVAPVYHLALAGVLGEPLRPRSQERYRNRLTTRA